MLPFFLFLNRHNIFVSIYKNHIAIIGAGISGLALGIVLKEQNIPCVIFEKLDSISEHGAGISISRNGQKVLKELGVLDQLKLISGNPKIKVEVSGSVNLSNINKFVIKGVHYISVGDLTKNVESKDLSMLIV